MNMKRVAPRPGARPLRGAFLAAAGAVLLGLAPAAAGWAAESDSAGVLVAEHRGNDRDTNWDDDWGDAWEDYNRTILQMQRESISSQEEQAREVGRQQRREEIEQDREKTAAEREAYFDAILEASQASLRAPRGVYYRKPGYSSSDPPGPAATTVEIGGVSYLYDQGIFWLQQGSDYLVVTAPVGAVVGSLPRGAVRVPAAGTTLWYFFGTFLAEKDGGLTVVKPPAGVLVLYLPDGYLREKLRDAEVYRFGETLYKPLFVQGVLTYQVVTGP